MIKALLIDGDTDHSENLERALNQRGVATSCTASIWQAVKQLKCRAASIDLVLLAIDNRPQPWLEILNQLQQAAWQAGIRDFPFFVCIARRNHGAEFQLQVERMGARYVIE